MRSCPEIFSRNVGRALYPAVSMNTSMKTCLQETLVLKYLPNAVENNTFVQTFMVYIIIVHYIVSTQFNQVFTPNNRNFQSVQSRIIGYVDDVYSLRTFWCRSTAAFEVRGYPVAFKVHFGAACNILVVINFKL